MQSRGDLFRDSRAWVAFVKKKNASSIAERIPPFPSILLVKGLINQSQLVQKARRSIFQIHPNRVHGPSSRCLLNCAFLAHVCEDPAKELRVARNHAEFPVLLGLHR